jgi:hypothetical protein
MKEPVNTDINCYHFIAQERRKSCSKYFPRFFLLTIPFVDVNTTCCCEADRQRMKPRLIGYSRMTLLLSQQLLDTSRTSASTR